MQDSFSRVTHNGKQKSKQSGFTLIELLIAILIAALSVLGLAYTQNKSLQYARSSSQYTRASIEASNTVEQIWNSLCELKDGSEALDDLTLADGFTRTFDPTTFDITNTLKITIDWGDQRLTDVEDEVSVQAVFPDICP
ncbi:prepilin-type N-terminal cleavage/methylation domain-containing protein [Psychromonas sp. 14N.309.X.WAT.B.A12]|jgi:type IV pilus assembly protein PilV|uniref:prepilin-type N-terminal cleavage/methylation domain-containing protein n=1 Tax=unclassified Psychromonas TaxID=2614957 RepID=UPI0025B03A0A|nr:prepilin-type N-terminal cleavage/methylation domain-containing protein [Psychromonas sp. 14N.309.X.WAT.B.A12]MDN2664001.1 prepilin-type N-terminal cleavage/methylation domain-containing protein [Psychromonas sp. 14N.309.X.WAT.B.A12]